MPQTNMPGEKTSPTQPIPTKPPPYSRTFVRRGRPDRLHAGAARAGAREPEEVPVGAVAVRSADRSATIARLGSINIGNTAGGVNWPGSGVRSGDAHLLHAGGNTGVTLGAGRTEGRVSTAGPCRRSTAEPRRKPRWEAEPNYGRAATSRRGASARRRAGRAQPRGGSGSGGAAPAAASGRRQALGEGLDGLPIVKPPYGVIAAIDLEQRQADLPGAARRHAGQRPQPPAAARHEHPEDRPERQRRHHGHQDDGRRRRSADHRAAGTCARRDAARVRQEDRRTRSARC